MAGAKSLVPKYMRLATKLDSATLELGKTNMETLVVSDRFSILFLLLSLPNSPVFDRASIERYDGVSAMHVWHGEKRWTLTNNCFHSTGHRTAS